jgi:hypothetical protein
MLALRSLLVRARAEACPVIYQRPPFLEEVRSDLHLVADRMRECRFDGLPSMMRLVVRPRLESGSQAMQVHLARELVEPRIQMRFVCARTPDHEFSLHGRDNGRVVQQHLALLLAL